MIFFILIFGVFWFFMIRPQVKKQKQNASLEKRLRKETRLGQLPWNTGKVSSVSEGTVLVDAGDGIKLK